MDWPGRVTIQIVLRLGEQPCGSRYSRWACREIGHDTAEQARDTAQHAYDTTDVGPATRHIVCHDTAQCPRSLGVVHAAWVHRAHSQGSMDVHPVHLTQSLLSALF